MAAIEPPTKSNTKLNITLYPVNPTNVSQIWKCRLSFMVELFIAFSDAPDIKWSIYSVDLKQIATRLESRYYDYHGVNIWILIMGNLINWYPECWYGQP